MRTLIRRPRYGRPGRNARTALVTVAAAAGLMFSAAPANAAPTEVTGGSSTNISSPALTQVALRNGILPLPVDGARLTRIGFAPFSTTTVTPVVSGTVDPAAFFAGNVQGRGGLKFIRPLCLCSVSLTNFNVVISGDSHVEASLNGDASKAVRLFNLDATDLAFGGTGGAIEINNAHLILTEEGAQALNTGLKTKAFKAGLVFADANTVIKYKL